MPAPLISILCHEADIAHAETLHKSLKPKENQRALKVWHPGLIPPGATKKKERDRHLHDARLVILLISPDFRADADLQGEARRLIEADKSVVPVRVRHTSAWEGEPYEDLHALATLTASDPDEAWGGVADELLKLITAPPGAPMATTPSPSPIAAAPAATMPLQTREEVIEALERLSKAEVDLLVSSLGAPPSRLRTETPIQTGLDLLNWSEQRGSFDDFRQHLQRILSPRASNKSAAPTVTAPSTTTPPSRQSSTSSPQALTWVQLGGLTGTNTDLTWETIREALLRDADEMSERLGAPALLFLTGGVASNAIN